ncbi:MAG: bifunctional phosphoglucose/phosphomannose isomerase [Bacteroidia bacterium]|nr:bifunctional phosphoglucose/phosphomannose isomerase [Bacteroidia bacterium]
MDKFIELFPSHLTEALESTKNIDFNLNFSPENIVIAGMGGSGIAGTFVSEYAEYKKAKVPIILSKTYHLPAFVSEKTLVIISSYSGNTIETIYSLKDAIHKQSTIISITSGGEIADICKRNHIPVLFIPTGYPPRAALGYSLINLLFILYKAGIISNDWTNEIKESENVLKSHPTEIREIARNVAKQIHNTFPIIYSLGGEAVPLRLRQQLNENSKILCSHHIFPEMNHNEIVGWKCLNAKHSVISLQSDYDLSFNQNRFDFCKKLFSQMNIPVIEIKAKGKSFLAQYLYLVHVADWISYELALLNDVDPIEVKIIEQLKNELNQ